MLRADKELESSRGASSFSSFLAWVCVRFEKPVGSAPAALPPVAPPVPVASVSPWRMIDWNTCCVSVKEPVPGS
jgi:hypothetical protein